ncbi:MAG TPA: BlaI/MecI/CopY family transcriptional regulator [Humisphaera sp.]|jgi:predicted transcriptional regulator|nr:BlaI/MecI/CopY family transcriptional regulator [Humisphaera sp.]
MPDDQTPRPTDGELEILNVLWRLGPSTVRAVHEELSARRGGVYTTTLKLLQIMTAKGLVVRDDSNRTHIFRARETADHTQRRLVSDLLDRAFGGSPGKLVLQALSSKRATPDELKQIRKLLNDYRSQS